MFIERNNIMKIAKVIMAGFLTTVMVAGSIPAAAIGSEIGSADDAYISEMAGSGTEADPYIITTREELEGIQANKYYKLGCDIDLGGAEDPWTPLDPGNGAGVFFDLDGNNKTIKGLYINGTSDGGYYALFKSIGGTAKVHDLTVEGKIEGQGGYVGGITGWFSSYGGAAEIKNCVNKVEINGEFGEVGGIAGHMYSGDAKVIQCYNAADITNNKTSGTSVTGGIAGEMPSTIQDCYNVGNISAKYAYAAGIAGKAQAGSVLRCYNFAKVTNSGTDANVCAGGIAGQIRTMNVANNYWRSGISGGATYGIGHSLDFSNSDHDEGTSDTNAAPLTEAEFADQSKFTGWDFDNVWTMSAALGRPVLVDNNEESSGSGASWTDVGTALAGGADVVLDGDVDASGTDTCITIPEGTESTLDLNGHTLNRGLTAATDGGSVISVAGSLTITDSSTDGTGTITGGNSSKGGGIYVDGGQLTVDGVIIKGNSATAGSGIYATENSKVLIKNAEITGNTCSGTETSGAVVANNLALDGKITVAGNTYTGGSDKADANVWVPSGKTVTVGTIEGGSKIGITLQSNPADDGTVVFTSGGAAGKKDFFTSDSPAYMVVVSGEELFGEFLPDPKHLLGCDLFIRVERNDVMGIHSS